MKKFFILITFGLVLPLTLSAQSVDILWQGDTYVPPFYEGRALWSKQSRITLVALPHGLGNSERLNYKWTKNGTVLGNINGIGRNMLSFEDTILSRQQIIKVEILSPNNSVLASTETTLNPTSPVLAVYENNPLYGFMFHQGVGGTYGLDDEEVTFAAFPIFFSVLNRLDTTLAYEWRTNAGGLETNENATYRIPDDASGTSEVTVKINRKGKILQNVSRKFLVKFGNENEQL